MKTKILLTSAILFCIVATSDAQINQGQYLLGGSASYNNNNFNEPPYNIY